MPLFWAVLKEFAGHLVQAFEGVGGLNDELDRQGRGYPEEAGAGRPPPRTPAMWLSSCWMTGCSWLAVCWRWSQGLSTIPAMDVPGMSSWKTWSVSGCLAKSL